MSCQNYPVGQIPQDVFNQAILTQSGMTAKFIGDQMCGVPDSNGIVGCLTTKAALQKINNSKSLGGVVCMNVTAGMGGRICVPYGTGAKFADSTSACNILSQSPSLTTGLQ